MHYLFKKIVFDSFFRFFKFILQLISRYHTWAQNAYVKSKTDLKDFSNRIKFLEYLELDLKVFYFKLNDICSLFEELLHSKVTVDVLELLKSKFSKTCKVIYICIFFHIFR